LFIQAEENIEDADNPPIAKSAATKTFQQSKQQEISACEPLPQLLIVVKQDAPFFETPALRVIDSAKDAMKFVQRQGWGDFAIEMKSRLQNEKLLSIMVSIFI
jgi:hypothetical protein